MSDQEPKNLITENLAPAGRLLLVATALLNAGMLYLILDDGMESLPSGSYPFYIFLLPVLISGFLFFWITAKFIEKIGIQIYKTHNKSSISSNEEKPLE